MRELRWRPWSVVVVLMAAACGGDDGGGDDPGVPVDAGIDGSPDPFAGNFDGPEDFPAEGCRPGQMGGAASGAYLEAGLRLVNDGGELTVYTGAFSGEERATDAVITDDHVLLRSVSYVEELDRWSLYVRYLCDVPAAGRVRGYTAFCADDRCWPVRPLEAERFQRLAGEGDGDGLTLLGELALTGGGREERPLNVRVEDDVAYLAMGGDGLRTVSLADPRQPQPLGRYLPAEPNYFNDVKLVSAAGRRYAVLAGAPSQVVDVTEPATPALVAQLPVSAHTLFIDDRHAFFVGGDRGLTIYDLSIPRAPLRRASWVPETGGGSFHDLHVAGGRAYLSTPNYGITIVDVRDPAAPLALGASPQDPDWRYWHSPWATTIGGRALVLNGDEGPSPLLRILDADPASPTFLGTVGEWGIPGPVSLHNIMAIGNRAYLTHYHHGVRVLDLSDPSAPRVAGYFNTWREQDATAAGYAHAIGLDLDPARRRIFVADTERGLLVLQASSTLMP